MLVGVYVLPRAMYNFAAQMSPLECLISAFCLKPSSPVKF